MANIKVQGNASGAGTQTIQSAATSGTPVVTLPDATGTLLISGGDLGTPSAIVLTNGTGLPLTTGVTGTLAVANGGTGVTTSSGASSVVLRDANGNISTNATFNGFTSVAASGTTITLTAASTPVYSITGSGGQVIQLPNATTLSNGAIFSFNNNQSSGAITVNNSSATLVVSVPSGAYVTVVLLSNATSAGTWDRHDQTPSNTSWSTNTLDYPGSITSATWNGATVTVSRGGTGATTLTGVLKGNGTSAFTAAVAGTDYQAPITLTTTGTSGAATFAGNTLNIPQYSGGGGSPGGSTTQVQYNSSGSFAGSANLTFDGTTLTAAGFSGPHNGTVGATTASTGAFTTLSASSTVSGTGFSTYLASPPAIGGTAAAAGTFTTGTFNTSTVHKGATSGTVTISAPTVAGTQSYTLPTALPAVSGYALTSTTGGVMSWAASGSGTPGGSNTQIQFNNSSAFGGSANLTWDGTNVQLGATGALRFADTDSSNYVAFKSPGVVSANVTWTLPATDGSASQVLSTNGSGTLSWASSGAATVASGCIYLNSLTISANYTIAASQGAHSVGPITVSSGVTLTVSSGSRYVIA